MPGIGTFISAGRSLEQAIERVRLAESLGYDSTYVTHIAGRDSLTVLAAYAAATERIRLGTGVLPIYSRTPAATAQTAATIDELSGGRMVLGVGVSHRLTVEAWYGQSIDRPVTEMREYVGAIRAMFRGEEPPEGEKWPTRFRFMGYEVRPELPIYIAALSPNMLRLAGEIGDGVLLWLCDPPYVRDVVIPEVTKGRERAGKTLDGFDVVPAVPAAVTADRAATLERLRGDLVTYLSLPFYRSISSAPDSAARSPASTRASPPATSTARRRRCRRRCSTRSVALEVPPRSAAQSSATSTPALPRPASARCRRPTSTRPSRPARS